MARRAWPQLLAKQSPGSCASHSCITLSRWANCFWLLADLLSPLRLLISAYFWTWHVRLALLCMRFNLLPICNARGSAWSLHEKKNGGACADTYTLEWVR